MKNLNLVFSFGLAMSLLITPSRSLAESTELPPQAGLFDHVGIACMMFSKGNWIRYENGQCEQITFSSYHFGHISAVSTTSKGLTTLFEQVYLFEEHGYGSGLTVQQMAPHMADTKYRRQEFGAVSPAPNNPSIKGQTFTNAETHSSISFAFQEPNKLVITQDGKSKTFVRANENPTYPTDPEHLLE